MVLYNDTTSKNVEVYQIDKYRLHDLFDVLYVIQKSNTKHNMKNKVIIIL